MLYGNLTRDPELKALPNGAQVCNFSLATNRRYKKADGTPQEETEFHNIVCYGKLADSCAMYLKKGSAAYIEGRLKTRSWEGDKGKQYKTEIVAAAVQFGPRPLKGAEDDVDQRPPAERAATGQDEAKTGEPGIDYPLDDINPDDIPF